MDVSKMTQRNPETGKTRAVRRQSLRDVVVEGVGVVILRVLRRRALRRRVRARALRLRRRRQRVQHPRPAARRRDERERRSAGQIEIATIDPFDPRREGLEKKKRERRGRDA